MQEPRKLKRAVIKEEFVELTGKFQLAITLQQMLYWSERRKDADKFLTEELERIVNDEGEAVAFERIDPLLSHGWIYKKAEELSEETMIGVSSKAMRDYLKDLVTNGWLDERKNPKNNWDRTKQYRVNLLKIQQDLNKLGYALEGYSLPNLQNVNTYLPQVNSNEQNVNTNEQNVNTKGRKGKSNTRDYTETTKAETTNNKDTVFVEDVISYLNEKANKNFKPTTTASINKINKWKKQGFTLEDFKTVIDNQVSAWLNDPKMNEYLRPTTLFNEKFEGYLNKKQKGGRNVERPQSSYAGDTKKDWKTKLPF
jgi:uncharacterized phage protein (TIGR02220 family)